MVHPGHIVGPGWNPLNLAGHFDPQIFTAIPAHSIAKSERLIGYAPRYTSLEAVYEAVDWPIEKGIVKTE